MVQSMAKIYTVSADSTYVPTHFGGGRAARKIDTVPNPLNQEGLALTLNAEFVKHAVCVPSAGHEAQIAFSALHPAIYTTGLFQCFAVCVAYNKVGQEFHNGYLAHISSPHGQYFAACIKKIPDPNNTWAVVSVGPGNWGALIASKLVNSGIPANNVWIYIRKNHASGFGLDRFGNFGEV